MLSGTLWAWLLSVTTELLLFSYCLELLTMGTSRELSVNQQHQQQTNRCRTNAVTNSSQKRRQDTVAALHFDVNCTWQGNPLGKWQRYGWNKSWFAWWCIIIIHIILIIIIIIIIRLVEPIEKPPRLRLKRTIRRTMQKITKCCTWFANMKTTPTHTQWLSTLRWAARDSEDNSKNTENWGHWTPLG